MDRRALTRIRPVGCAVGLLLMTLAVYAEVVNHPFHIRDDPQYVVDNPVVQRGLSSDGVAWAFTQVHVLNWHPLTWVSHMVDVEIFGVSPGAHHLINVVLHGLNATLVFAALLAMTRALGPSAVVAGLFALHPAHVESVAWIAERKDMLSTLFGLLSLICWLGYVRRGSRAAYWGSVVIFALSLMSKPMLVTLPCVLLLFDLWPLERLQGPGWLRRRISEKLPHFALAAASCVITIHAQSYAIWSEFPLGARVANALVSYRRYVEMTFWPGELAAHYPFNAIPGAAAILGSTLFLIAVTTLVLATLRRRPYLAVGWLFFLGTLVPAIGLVQVGSQAMADRYSYVPITGLFIAIVWLVWDGLPSFRGRRAALATLAGAALLANAAVARTQLAYWRDDVVLFSRALEVTEDNYLAHVALGQLLMTRGEVELGIAQYRRSLEIQPGFADAHHGLGLRLAERGDLVAGARHLERAVSLRPEHSDALYQLGRVYERLDREAEAFDLYGRQIAANPDHSRALMRRATLRLTHPDQAQRDPVDALALAWRLCELTGYSSARELDVLAAALAANGRFPEAVEHAGRALALARAAGDPGLARMIRNRLERYRAGRALRL
jgi:tetratricopeptide (TPR) repeat protein